MLVCYLDISFAEDRHPSILIRQRMIVANNFSFLHCKLSFKNEGVAFNFKCNGEHCSSSVEMSRRKLFNEPLGC